MYVRVCVCMYVREYLAYIVYSYIYPLSSSQLWYFIHKKADIRTFMYKIEYAIFVPLQLKLTHTSTLTDPNIVLWATKYGKVTEVGLI